MKLVQTLVVRDEADIVGEQIAYHLNAGVDFVIASDHASEDGTTQDPRAIRSRRSSEAHPSAREMRDGPWRTHMARLASTEHGADWVINTDADEFWMPRGGTLKDVFTAVPASLGGIYALSKHFVPRPEDGSPFFERMTVHASPAVAINDPTSPFRPHLKVAHRAVPTSRSASARTRIEPALGRAPPLAPGRGSALPLSLARPVGKQGLTTRPRRQAARPVRDRPPGEGDRTERIAVRTVRRRRSRARAGPCTRLLDDRPPAARRGPCPRSRIHPLAVGSLVGRERPPRERGGSRRRHRPAPEVRRRSRGTTRHAREARARGDRRIGSPAVSVVMTTEVTDRVEHLERFLAFHKSARVTAVLVSDANAPPAALQKLEPYVQEGFVHRLGGASATELARLAVSEHGADWVVPSTTEELWWPRAESLEDVLAVVPHRYGVVQALVRRFVGNSDPPTVRTSLLGPRGSAAPRRAASSARSTGRERT